MNDFDQLSRGVKDQNISHHGDFKFFASGNCAQRFSNRSVAYYRLMSFQ